MPVNEWLCTTPSDACTQRGCNAGGCFEEPKDCNDGNPCTSDSCDVEKGGCVHVFTCDDGNACTIEFCIFSTGECVREYACPDDNDPCTEDRCVQSSAGSGYTCEYEECPSDVLTQSVVTDTEPDAWWWLDRKRPQSRHIADTPIPQDRL